MLIQEKQINSSVFAAKLRPENKDMAASVTVADGSLACATALAVTPRNGGYVEVRINGAGQTVGDAVKTKDCYFSADGGATAKAFAAPPSAANIAAGDLLYWNGATIAGFQLAITDKVDFIYWA